MQICKPNRFSSSLEPCDTSRRFSSTSRPEPGQACRSPRAAMAPRREGLMPPCRSVLVRRLRLLRLNRRLRPLSRGSLLLFAQDARSVALIQFTRVGVHLAGGVGHTPETPFQAHRPAHSLNRLPGLLTDAYWPPRPRIRRGCHVLLRLPALQACRG